MDVALGSPHLGETHASRWMPREPVSRLLGDADAKRGCGAGSFQVLPKESARKGHMSLLCLPWGPCGARAITAETFPGG